MRSMSADRVTSAWTEACPSSSRKGLGAFAIQVRQQQLRAVLRQASRSMRRRCRSRRQ